MKYFYLLLVGFVSIGALYSLFGIGFFKWTYYQIENPKAEFLVINNEAKGLTIVDFVNYHCSYCKDTHPAMTEALKLHKDIRYVVRPILLPTDPQAEIKQEPAELEKLALAAGIQGKFKEINEAFMEYPETIIPEEVIKETALLYGIDYKKMVEDSKSKKVQKYLDDNVSDMLGLNIQTIPSYVVGKNIYVVMDKMPDVKDFLEMITNEKK